MSLLDHFKDDVPAGMERFGVEDFVFLFQQWELGTTGFDKQRIIDWFPGFTTNPTADADEIQLDQMKAVIDGIPQPNERQNWLSYNLRQPLLALETGSATESEVESIIGI